MSDIALLCTGSELVRGEVLNTNGPFMANALSELGFQVGQHLTVDDDESELAAALQYLMKSHAIVLCCGGLGPTSDDRTRFAAAQVFNQSLVFNADVWALIVNRMKRTHQVIPDSNRQQALFPETATIFPNANGTAAGFVMTSETHALYLLPGPPRECLPMFQEQVLPSLSKRLSPELGKRLIWRCFDVSESLVADQIETLCQPFACQIAYRAFSPYLDVKIHVHDAAQADAVEQLVESALKPSLIPKGSSNAIEALQLILQQRPEIRLNFFDGVTRGALQSALQRPQNQDRCRFSAEPYETHKTTAADDEHQIIITGLEAYWGGQPASETQISMTLWRANQRLKHSERTLKLREQRMVETATDWCAMTLNIWLSEMA